MDLLSFEDVLLIKKTGGDLFVLWVPGSLVDTGAMYGTNLCIDMIRKNVRKTHIFESLGIQDLYISWILS